MALLKLKNPREVPNGMWRFPRYPDRPLTGSDKDFIFGGDVEDLAKKISEFRILNDLPLGNPREEAEDWLCRNAGSECVPVRVRGFTGMKVLGADLARFVNALGHWMTSADVVPQEEAERRAEICAACKYNVPLSDVTCAGCYGLAARIAAIIGNVKTRMENNLQFCAICSCSNQVQVYAPLQVLNRAHPLADFPTDVGDGTPCWKKTAESQV